MVIDNKNNLAWVDIETTGFNPQIDKILEIGIIITDWDLNIVREAAYQIKHSDEIMDKMDVNVLGMHTVNNLLRDMRMSSFKLSAVENVLLSFLEFFCDVKTTPMCGSSVHFDRSFLKIHMPKLHDHFSYRNIDVSTLTELGVRWNPSIVKAKQVTSSHRALPDLRTSIDLLKHYKLKFMRV